MAGWKYFDPDTHQWVSATAPEIARRSKETNRILFITWEFGNLFPAAVETPKEPWADLSAEADPKGIICRPCSESAHGECEGKQHCRCQLCTSSLLDTIREMTEEWNLLDRSEGWT